MQDYHKLLVWKRAMAFVSHTYRLTKLFPDDERFGLTSQYRRAAVSIVANIVEGRGKQSDKDFRRFLYISNGSLNECQCFLEIAKELVYINDDQFEFMYNKTKEIGYLLSKLIKAL